MSNPVIDISRGFCDHNALNFRPGTDLVNRIVYLESGDMGFIPHCEALYETESPDDVTPDMYSVALSPEIVAKVWNDNQATEVGASLESVCRLTGDTIRLVRDDGNDGSWPESWFIEKDGKRIAYFDHDALGLMKNVESFTKDAINERMTAPVDFDEVIRALMGLDEENV
jgi:hypothetical protein